MIPFEVVGEISDVEVIAIGSRIRDLERLRKLYGGGRWRKLKGVAIVKLLDDGSECTAELHWMKPTVSANGN